MTPFDEAISFAQAHESSWDREVSGNFGVHLKEPAPWNRLYGPLHSRGPQSGVIACAGRELAAWGEPDRADLTYSIAKTYLALLAGVAHDRGLLPDVDERIGQRLKGIGFDADNNARITWRHMLQQTSEWEGTLWDIPDQADRYRAVTFGAKPAGSKGEARPLQLAGAYWEYNDIRINQLALALMHLFRRPLPEVFRESITRPVGATENWRWEGYDNAWVQLEGRRAQSVTGGSHWGGGVSISARDQVRIAQMLLDQGLSGGHRVLSAEWIRQMQVPCAIAPYYGYLVWLNTGRRIFPDVPESSYFGIGAGSNFMWIEPQRRIVAVIRWLDPTAANALFARILQAVDAA